MEHYLCRLCLTAKKVNLQPYKLFQEVYCKIRACISFNLAMNEGLPDKLCMKCVNSIEEMYAFCMTVKENENILQNYLEDGTLADYYTHLSSDFPIKKEIKMYSNNESINKNKIFVVKELNEIHSDVTSKNNECENEDAIIKIKSNINYEFDDTIKNSADEEDNIALSSIKSNKDSSNTVNDINNAEINRDRTIICNNSKNVLLMDGTLADYYTHLSSDFPIKKEIKMYSNNESINKNKIFVVKELNEIHSDVTSKNNECENEDAIIKIESNINYEFDDTINNSADEEDNIALSSIKSNKDSSNTVNDINNTEINRDRTIICNNSKNVLLEKYSCLTCNKTCESHNKLREHYHQEHSNKNTKAIELTYTETTVNGIIMYKCDRCSKVYAKKNLKRHLLHHTGVRPYVCKLCSRSYITVSDIMRHGTRAHSGIKMLCAYNCGFSTAYSGALKTHEDRVHKNENKYTCETCGKGFQAKTWYEQHQNIHTGLRPYICDICGHSFHMEKNLTSHHWNMHPGKDKRRLICVHCDLKCESEKALDTHLQSEHGVTRKRPNRRKKALCDLCGKILNRPEDLVLHRRMHLGQKPYKCSICSKRFPRKFTLQVHERSHSRDTSHECDRCGKRYSQQSALYRHQRQQHALPPKRQKTVENS